MWNIPPVPQDVPHGIFPTAGNRLIKLDVTFLLQWNAQSQDYFCFTFFKKKKKSPHF